jgi:hypothetical protein
MEYSHLLISVSTKYEGILITLVKIIGVKSFKELENVIY